MQLGLGAVANDQLAVRLAWLTALRLLVLTLLFVATITLYAGGFARSSYSTVFSIVAVGVAYALAAVYAVMLRLRKALVPLALVQLVTDQIAWTAVVYVSGGVTSGAASLYGLTCLSGAILLGRRGGVTAAVSGIVAFFLLAAGFATHAIAPPADQPADAYAANWHDVGYAMLVNGTALLTVTTLASYLADRLAQTGGRLEVATARAERAERLASLGRLAAGLAHEIRNPLGAISGSIELLRTGGTLSPEDQELCAIVERETRRLNELVTDMLDLAKPKPPQVEPFDVAATARDVVVLASSSGRGADVRVRYDGPDAATVSADPAQMRQVVWNLVRNAVQASSAGSEVVVRIAPAEDATILEVRDRGAGITADKREHLFDVFFTTRSQGMGIGLAVVKRIVDDHGFGIEVESDTDTEDRGTVFRVRMAPA